MSSSSSLFREIAEIIVSGTVALIVVEAFVSLAYSANITLKNTLPPLIEALVERREKNNNCNSTSQGTQTHETTNQ